jgi:hypothetical protein
MQAMDEARRQRISQGVRASIEERRRAGTYTPPAQLVERWLVRQIVRDRQRGKSLRQIARGLTLCGFPTPRGGCTWAWSTVRKILIREGAL